jgi:propanediol dehydratase large subunit
MKQSVVVASGSDQTRSFSAGHATRISCSIATRQISVLDVIRALNKRGFREEAENLLFLVKLRLSGDYLQTSAVIRNNRVISAINDPNRYDGPGTGYRLTEARRKEIANIRGVLDQGEVLRTEATFQRAEEGRIRYRSIGPAQQGAIAREVVVGLSPGFGSKLFRTTAGHPLSAVLQDIRAGIEEAGGTARFVRFLHTADTSFLGLSAARLSGSGIGIGLQAKGTAVIHRKDRLPHNNLELFSNAPITKLEHYRGLGRNAALYASGAEPEPIVVPTRGEALGARHHARVALIYAIETGLVRDGAEPEELAVDFLVDNQ